MNNATSSRNYKNFSPITHYQIGSKYYTILTVISLPEIIYPGFLAGMTNIPGVKVAIKHIPTSLNGLLQMITNEVSELKLKHQAERDPSKQENIRNSYETLEEFSSMLQSSGSKAFDFQMHLLVSAKSKEELDNRTTRVKYYLSSMDIKVISFMFEQEEVLYSMLPIFPPQQIQNRIGIPLASATIAGMYPFIFDSIKDPGSGTLLGTDSSGGVVMFNQFLNLTQKEPNRDTGNIIIVGTNDSGKTTLNRILLRTNLRNGFKCVAIDPDGSLEGLTRFLSGDFLDMGRPEHFGIINPLEIVNDVDDEEVAQGLSYTVLTRCILQLKAFMKYLFPNIEKDVLEMFENILNDTYLRFKITKDSDFSKLTSRDFPTFNDVHATIKGRLLNMSEATEERDIIDRLEQRVKIIVEDYKKYFVGQTTLNNNTDFTVFNLNRLTNESTTLQSAIYFNCLRYGWGLCVDKTYNSCLHVDGLDILFNTNNEYAMEYIANIQRKSVKYNNGTVLTFNTPNNLMAKNLIMHSKSIFENTSYYMIMGLSKPEVNELAKLLVLNENEKETIRYYNTGQALFICGTRRMNIQIIASESELEVTSPILE